MTGAHEIGGATTPAHDAGPVAGESSLKLGPAAQSAGLFSGQGMRFAVRNNKHWTETELATLRTALDDASLTRGDIAVLLRRGVGAIAHKISEKGWTRERAWTADDDARLSELRALGLPNREIASRIGRTEKAVGFRIYQRDAPKRQRRAPWMGSELVELARMLSNGATEQEAAEYFGRSLKAIQLKAWTLRRAGRINKQAAAMDSHIATLIARGINPVTANMLRAAR